MNFGRFEIRGRLGEGAAGSVHRAFDPELGREVALKLLHRVDELKAKRFEREAEVTASLSHPGILKVHTFGVLDGVPYLVCELVEGARTFEQVVDALSPEDLDGRVELLRQAAIAIGHAHAQGVVHRDLKPSNLLIDGEGRLRVADFGVATGQDLERLTLTGVWVGTPLYMAPEQLYCERERIGPHTDVWALGAMLYEALTGELPFDAATPMELLTAARGRVRSPRSLRSELPLALEQICLRALESDASARYATGGELARALEGYLSAGTGEARSRGRSWAAAMILALVAATVALVVTNERSRASGERLVATLQPSATQVEGSLAPALDPVDFKAESAAELERALAVKDERRQLTLLTAWCRANPEHPRLRRALRARDKLSWKHPVFEGQLWGWQRGTPQGALVGESFLAFQSRTASHGVTKFRRLRFLETQASAELWEPERLDPRGICSIPGGGYALVLEKGLLVSERGEEPTLVSATLPPGDVVRLSAQPASAGGTWIALATERAQVVLRVASGAVVAEQAISGWPLQAKLRGVLLTPARCVILYGTRVIKGGLDRGLALRYDAETGESLVDLGGKEELNAILSAAFDPADPRRIMIGTRFGRVLIFEEESLLRLVSKSATKLGLGARAHACAVRYVGFWRQGKILTVGCDPDIPAVVRIWDAASGLEQEAISLNWRFRTAHSDGRHLLLLGVKEARVYQLD